MEHQMKKLSYFYIFGCILIQLYLEVGVWRGYCASPLSQSALQLGH